MHNNKLVCHRKDLNIGVTKNSDGIEQLKFQTLKHKQRHNHIFSDTFSCHSAWSCGCPLPRALDYNCFQSLLQQSANLYFVKIKCYRAKSLSYRRISLKTTRFRCGFGPNFCFATSVWSTAKQQCKNFLVNGTLKTCNYHVLKSYNFMHDILPCLLI